MAEKRNTLWDWLRSPRRRVPISTRRPRFRPWLESLETRDVPSTLLVVNTLDSGPGSLRDAIHAANLAVGAETVEILFQIPAADSGFIDVDAHLPGGDLDPDVFHIALLSALPALTRGSITINGASQQSLTGDTNPWGPEIVLAGDLASGIDVPGGLVGHYRFNGTIEDVAGDNNPVATAGINFVDGKVGHGVTFEPGGYIDIPHSDDLANQTFTLSAWVRPDGPGPNDDEFGSIIIAKGIANLDTSVTLNWSAQSRRFLLSSGNVTVDQNRTFSAGTFAPGQFYHVAATFDGTTFRLYVDGVFQGEHVRSVPIEYEPSIPWTIGSTAEIFRVRPDQPDFPRTWNGVIDEVGIFNRALDAVEIQSLATPASGLHLASSDNVVHGLNIQGFSGDGILIAGNNNTLTGNYIGTNARGDALNAAPAGIVGWWRGEGNAADTTGNHDGTLVNGTTFAPGIVGQAFSLDGVDDVVTTPLVVDYTGGVTFELWVKTTDQTHSTLMAGGGGATASRGMGLFLEPGGVLLLMGTKETPGVPNFQIFPGPNIADGVFHHVAATWTGDTTPDGVRLYLDGELIGTTTALTAIETDAAPLHLGDHADFYFPLIGLIDEPTVYNRVLSGGEVAFIHSRATLGKSPTIPGNRGDGVRVVDSSGNFIGGRTDAARNVISGNVSNGIAIVGQAALEFDDKERFLAATGAVDATGPLPNLGQVFGQATIGDLTFSPAAGTTLHIGGLGGPIEDWYPDRAGNELALGQVEDFNVDLAVPVRSFGFELIEPDATMPPWGGTPVESEFTVTLLRGGAVVDSFTFSRENDVVTFVGFSSPNEFDRVEIRETTGAEDDEYFGRFYVGGRGGRNTIQGNYIGTTADGTAALGNGAAGVYLDNSADNRIGGAAASARNVISGNRTGVWILGELASGNHVAGNYIGLGADGITALGNHNDGVLVSGPGFGFGPGAAGNRIGGTDAAERNVISANGQNNVVLSSSGTIVQGNYIGTDHTGMQLPSVGIGGRVGVRVGDDVNSVIGGTEEGAGNVVAGHFGWGIYLSGRFAEGGAQGTRVQGNRIGTTADGKAPLANIWGVYVDGFVDSNGSTRPITDLLIGGAGAGNLISGNHQGIVVFGPGSKGVTIQGNLIGTDIDGMVALPNGITGSANPAGVLLDSASNVLIGGLDEFARNVISGNDGSGIAIVGGNNHIIQGNYIGTTADGLSPLGNLDGVTIQVSGGPSPGGINNVIDGNVISANDFGGISIAPAPGFSHVPADNVITGNFIGTDKAGLAGLGNGLDGIVIKAVVANRIGGLTDAERNIIVDNFRFGILLEVTAGNLVQGNYIGVAADGVSGLGNNFGIGLANDTASVIGGTEFGAGNVISANNIGVTLYGGLGTRNARIEGNRIGTTADAMTALGNVVGIDLVGQDGNKVIGVTIGGTEPGAGNLISGNQNEGIRVRGSGAEGIVIQGNIVGADRDGMAALANSTGVVLTDVSGALVGGAGPEARNVISGNTYGLVIGGAEAAFNHVAGNYMGVGVDGRTRVKNTVGLAVLGASGDGAGVHDNLIGGPTEGERNIISGSDHENVLIGASLRTVIQGNYVGPDVDGDATPGSLGSLYGVRLVGTAHDTLIIGNVISGHAFGVRIDGAVAPRVTAGTRIVGNIIGATADGRQALHNSFGIEVVGHVDSDGITHHVEDLTIGGIDPDAGNLISGNTTGILVLGPGAQNVKIQGNLIGTDKGGVDALPNVAGVGLEDASGVLIGGTEEGARNIISGNTGDGIRIEGDGPEGGNIIQGNYIGTTADGMSALGNLGQFSAGVKILDSSGNLIGGATAGARNVIGGSAANIEIRGAASADNVIQGNYIGVNRLGAAALDAQASERAILIVDARRTVVGGSDPEAGNVIAGHSGNAIEIFRSAGNLIEGNKIGTNAAGDEKIGNFGGVRFVDSSDNEVVRNLVSGNAFSIRVEGQGSTGFVARGNLIGTNLAGTEAIPNTFAAISIIAASGALIGGVVDADRNLISGSANANGIFLDGGSDHQILGNYIGTDVSGSNVLGGMFAGIDVVNASNVRIGGAAEGAGNLISGNSLGIYVRASSTDVRIQGNRVGTDVGGATALPNSTAMLIDSSTGVLIGGTEDGAGNLISGNTNNAISIVGGSEHIIQGNFVGTDVTGTVAVGNLRGIWIVNSPANKIIGNVVSGNSIGIEIDGASSTDQIIEGNYVGADLTGTQALGNSTFGILLRGASGALIGGTNESQRNLISGNGSANIQIDSASHDITIQGNIIGPDITGTLDLGNGFGIRILDSWTIVVGGGPAGAGNLISGNITGVDVQGADAANNRIQGNRIGTDVTGTVALGNFTGVSFGNGAHDNFVGTDGDGVNDATEGNLVSGNTEGGLGSGGVFIFGAGTRNNVVAGNLIGADVTGRSAIPNSVGVGIFTGPHHNRIGTNADGVSDDLERNVISGNVHGIGISVQAGLMIGADHNVIAGNYIGTDVTGAASLRNTVHGIAIGIFAGQDFSTPGPKGTIIGGTDPVERNIIAGNGGHGILLDRSNETIIQGNYVGADVTGTHAFPNATGAPGGTPAGILVASSSHTLIGGNTPGAGNLISGNHGYGVQIWYDHSEHNRVQGNLIGTDATGTVALGNTGGGVSSGNGARFTIIGADGDRAGDAFEGNVISGNAASGVVLSGAGATNNVVAGNLIGTDAFGRAPIENTVSWYRAEGDADDAVSGFDGTLSGNVTFTPGKVGQAFNFDGGDASRVLVANNAALEPSAAVTVDAWVRSSDVGLVNYILAKGANGAVSASYALYSGAQGGLQFYVTIGGIFYLSPDAGAGLWDGDWHHVAGTYDGSSVRLFVDGLEIGNGTAATGSISYALPTSNDLSIGHYPISGANGAGFEGSIDEIAVYDRALSTAEIQFIHAQGTAGKSGELGNGGDGIRIENGANNNIVGGTSAGAGNLISGNARGGLTIQSASGNLVQGNTIGLSASGDRLGNRGEVTVVGGANNTIGGGATGAGNVIAGGNDFGVAISASTGTRVQGNWIGTDRNFSAGKGNAYGVVLLHAAADNFIGIDGDGVNDATEGNVIVENQTFQVLLHSPGTENNVVAGNFIGTDPTGTRDLSDAVGIYVFNGARNNRIGTNADGISDAAERNVIGGNLAGVLLNGSDGNVVAGNYVGTDAAGAASNPNETGIVLQDAANNVIGGTTAGAGNLISGNTNAGVSISGGFGHIVQGNTIGLAADGVATLGNGSGVVITDAADNLVGGPSDEARNVISASTASYGVIIQGFAATGNVVEGNYIGTDAASTLDRGNAFSGVALSDTRQNTLRGNVISGNSDSGVFLVGSTPQTDITNFIENNFIGTDASGTRDLGNTLMGVRVSRGVGPVIRGNLISGNDNTNILVDATASRVLIENNRIGTDWTGNAKLVNAGTSGFGVTLVGPNNVVRDNVISANPGDGVNIDGQDAGDARGSDNVVAGNIIGLGLDGVTPLGNRNGIRIWRGASDNTIGGLDDADRNVISANGEDGVRISGGRRNSVFGNHIGTTADGMTARGNIGAGVRIGESPDNVVGGSTEAGNVIAGNSVGVWITGEQSQDNHIASNTIGLGSDGVTALGNSTHGIFIQGNLTLATGPSQNLIGGTTAAERNVIASNGQNNVFFEGTQGNTIQGNYIGTDVTGTLARGSRVGVRLVHDHDSLIGGAEPGGAEPGGAEPGAGNLISGNQFGISIAGSTGPDYLLAEGIRIQGNRIGTKADGQSQLGNSFGIYLNGFQDDQQQFAVSDITIGGDEPGAGNVISGNFSEGIQVVGRGATDVVIQGNYIGTNSDGSGVIANRRGILLDHAAGVLIGGSSVGARNIISGNSTDGISVLGAAGTVRHQSFDDEQSAAAQGWTGFGNNSNRQDFGYSATSHTGADAVGEAGGVFARASFALGELSNPIAYYADTQLGQTLTLEQPLLASGELIITDTNEFDGGVHLSFFHRGDAEANLNRNRLGLAIQEPGSGSGVVGLRAAATITLADGTSYIGNPVHTPAGLALDAVYTWRFEYDPQGGTAEQGMLTVEVFADGVSLGVSVLELSAIDRAVGIQADAFGFTTGGVSARTNNPNTIELYIDDLTYAWSADNAIQGNYIGTDATGTQALRNFTGIHLDNAADNLIGGAAPGAGNVIAGNTGNIRIVGPDAARNRVQGNLIGLDVTGTMAATNGFLTGTNDNGITIEGGAHYNLIGGATPGAGNVISGHWEGGIGVTGGSSRNLIQGNRIGTNAAGTAAVGNGAGVAFGDGEDNRVIGNLVSGNNTGIGIFGANVTNQVVVQRNLIGTDITGTLAVPNHFFGIRILNAPRARIGGTDPAERNVISGNSSYGILMGGARETVVQGNYIGTDITGTQALGNQTGIWITDNADDNLIGGGVPGARNLISGNGAGVNIDGFSNNNRVHGNYIGTDVTGTVAITAGTGVTVGGGAAENFIGTDGDGVDDALEGNLISGNDSGVLIWAGARDNVVAGNLIGTDPTGRAPVRNAHGVTILLASNNLIGSNADGVSDDVERNVIAGNRGGGVLILAVPDRTDGADDNLIAGNYIGVDRTGLAPLGNGWHGILVGFSHIGEFLAPPTGTIIGGPNPAQRNIIANSGGYGIFLDRAADTVIQGNYVGTDVTGTRAFPNAHDRPGGPPNGILIASSTNTLIGGGTPGSGNLISGNLGYGLAIWYEGSVNNRVQGNLIGTDASGTYALGNTGGGVSSGVGARLTVIGTDGDGINDAFEGNVISGNQDPNSANTWGLGVGNEDIVAGNKIGTDITGTKAIPNATGVLVSGFGTRIGTNADGVSDELERNIISGNLFAGVGFGFGAANVVLSGNIIGLDVNGDPLGNGGGIDIRDARDILIGTNADGIRDDLERNVISGNHSGGIGIRGAGPGAITTGNVIAGNYIGVGLDGITDRGNAGDGVWLSHGSHDALIGGAHPAARNIIAGNDGMGLRIDDSTDHRILGNFIGVDRTGTAALPNNQGGVKVFSYYYTGVAGQLAAGNRIGGALPGEGNVIAGNAAFGVAIVGQFATDNRVQGNFIGVDASGASALANLGPGIHIEAPGNLIGGPAVTAGNVISGNAAAGILLLGAAASSNRVQRNLIGAAAGGRDPLGNLGPGIHVDGAAHNQIDDNLVADNQTGLELTLGAHHNVLVGNFIGTDRAGTRGLGNAGHGILLADSAASNAIGTPEQPNMIAFNGQTGVAIVGGGVKANSLRGNSIFDNGALGIDRGADGVTAVGLPELQLVAGGAQTFVEGRLQAEPNTTYTLDFYASPRVDPSLYGEGQRYLGSIPVTTGPGGAATFQALLPSATAFGEFVTATATGATGDTSEFSLAVAVAIDANEPNDEAADATSLGSLDDNNGRIEPRALIAPTGDRDLYRLDVPVERLVEIQTFADREGSLLDTILTLRDQAGNLLALNDDFVGQDSVIRERLQPGAYFIEVSGFQGSVGPYRLVLIDRDFAGPQILRLTPSKTVAAGLNQLQLWLDGNDLDPSTVTTDAFVLERLDAAGEVNQDHSSAIVERIYDAQLDRLTLRLGATLPDAAYRLTVRDSIRSLKGLRLDGDQQGGPGGGFVGAFAIDGTAPVGTVAQAGVAGEDALGVRYRFAGSVSDGHPAAAGEVITIELDVDGDGFDDGRAHSVLLGSVQTPFAVAATTGIAPGQGMAPVSVRFVDARGNRSSPQTVVVDTDLPVVTSVRPSGASLQVTFNLPVDGADQAGSYAVAGQTIVDVLYAATTQTAELTLAGGLPDGTYAVSVFAGTDGIQRDDDALDGDGDGRAGGTFAATVLVDRVAPIIGAVQLAAASDSGLPGDGRTNQVLLTFDVAVSDVFPTTTSEVTVLVDVDGDGFDDGVTRATLTTGVGPVPIEVASVMPIGVQGLVPVRVRVVDAAGNAAQSSTSVFVDRDGPRLLPSSRGEVWRAPSGAVLGIRYLLEFDSDLDTQAALNAESYALFRAGGDRLFYDGDDVEQSARIASIIYQPGVPSIGASAHVELRVALRTDGPDNDDYELTAFAGRLVDSAANPLVGGDARLRFRFEALPPIVESAFLLSAVEGLLPNQLFVQFRDIFGLRNLAGRFLRDGDHEVTFRLGGRGGPAFAGQHLAAYPGGPVLEQAALSGAATPHLVLTFDQPLDPAEAMRASNYVLVGAGPDGRLRTPDDNLIVLPSGAVRLLDDGRTVTLDVDALDPGTYLVRIDGTGDAELDEQAVQNLDNYRLDRLDGDGQLITTLPLSNLHFNPFGDRVILSGFGSLAPGAYRLRVFTGDQGIANSTGAALDGNFDGRAGDAYVQVFNVKAGTPPAVFTLDANAFERNHAALEAFALQTEQDVLTSAKALAEADFAERLLTEVEIVAAAAAGPSTAIALAIHDAVRQVFEARLAELPILPNEFVVVWSHDARFLLADAVDPANRQIGFRLDGLPLDDQLPGGVVVGGSPNEDTGLPGLSIAIVPIDPVNRFFIGPPALDLSDRTILPDLGFTIELEGLSEANQVGLIYFGREGFAGTTTFVDVPRDIVREGFTPPLTITGFDPELFLIDAQVMSEVNELLRSLDPEGRHLLVMWVDPVDFFLRNPHNDQVGTVGSQTAATIPRTYYSGNGITELLVIAYPVGGRYQLDLIGLGADFRGALHIVTLGFDADVPFQGRLAADATAAAVIDLPSGPSAPLDFPWPEPQLNSFSTDIAIGLVQQLTAPPSDAAQLGAPGAARSETQDTVTPAASGASPTEAAGGATGDNPGSQSRRSDGNMPSDEPPPPPPPKPPWQVIVEIMSAVWRYLEPRLTEALQPAGATPPMDAQPASPETGPPAVAPPVPVVPAPMAEPSRIVAPDEEAPTENAESTAKPMDLLAGAFVFAVTLSACHGRPGPRNTGMAPRGHGAE